MQVAIVDSERHMGYYLSKGEVKNYNVINDAKGRLDPRIKESYENS